jgi:hypothetical protein
MLLKLKKPLSGVSVKSGQDQSAIRQAIRP